MGDYLVVESPLDKVDVLHVIAGDDERVAYAIRLYNEGYAGRLFFTGGWCDVLQDEHGRLAREQALEAGVPEAAIVIDDTPVTSTYMEAQRLKMWMDQQPTAVESVMVVSDPFHMRRVKWTYRWLLGKHVRLEMAPEPFGMSLHQRRWWLDDGSRRMVGSEYLKLGYYLLRYRLARGALADWLARFDTE